MPRWRPDGSKNAIHIQRLKNKVGNKSNSSSEVEFHDAWGVLMGEAGRGIPTIIEMATYTRLTCVLGSAAMMRQALVQGIAYTRQRKAFGYTLAQQPLMRAVLSGTRYPQSLLSAAIIRLRAGDPKTSDGKALPIGWHAAVILELGDDYARFGAEGDLQGHDPVIPAEDVTWARKRLVDGKLGPKARVLGFCYDTGERYLSVEGFLPA